MRAKTSRIKRVRDRQKASAAQLQNAMDYLREPVLNALRQMPNGATTEMVQSKLEFRGYGATPKQLLQVLKRLEADKAATSEQKAGVKNKPYTLWKLVR